jgi:DNA modification methylase
MFLRKDLHRDGLTINGDCTDPDVIIEVQNYLQSEGQAHAALIVTDPPYGNILDEKWDKTKLNEKQFASWMVDWTRQWCDVLADGGAFYVWGGIGKKNFRPFFQYMLDAETETFQLANLITWKKKRAYGVPKNYIFTREEIAYFIKGRAERPRKFSIPYLAEKRGYAGFNKKYPAKSEFYRRTNVWTEISEIFRGKEHPTQKPVRLAQIPIEIHTEPGEFVIDMFAGSGATAHAARSLDRKFILVEKDLGYYDKILESLK